ncbi:MAG: sugar-binding domain-containing protein [Clostridia bacterium]
MRSKVDEVMFREEYPRPDYIRKNWQPLNGEWDFEIADGKSLGQSYYLHSDLLGVIEVPFAPGALFSGVSSLGNLKSVWYKRRFELSKQQASGKVFLNFIAVDYRSEIYINGQLVSINKGGSLPFSIDITQYVVEGENIVAVNALDDETDSALPSGYQGKSVKGGAPSVTGIWGSVWLEFASHSYIEDCFAYCKAGEIILKGAISAPLEGGYFAVEVSLEGKSLSSYRYKATKDIFLSIPLNSAPELWNVLNGKLYDIDILLKDASGNTADSVRIYTFFRNIEMVNNRLAVNGKPVIIRAVDDYCYYGGGGSTAPSADIIKQDFLKLISLGFNAVRPVQRIPEPIYLYYADVLGLIVLEDYPSYGMDFDLDSAAQNIQADWLNLAKRDFGHPSIIFRQPVYSECNNAQAKHAMYNLIKSLDSSRFVMSGGLAFSADIIDIDVTGLTLNEVLEKIIERKNGTYTTKREERTLRKRYPSLMDNNSYAAYPFIVSGIGQSFSSSNRDEENAALKNYRALTQAALSAGAAGYIYSALGDTPAWLSGLADINRDDKLSRGGELELQRINSG